MDSMFVHEVASRWWALVLRGVVAILFGVLALTAPAAGLVALVVMWGVYALVDGVFTLVVAAHSARANRSWGWMLLSGLASIATGVATFAWPGITAMVLLLLIASWAIVTGITEIAAAIELRHQISGEWLLAASGVLSILFGALLFANPGSGALAVVWIIGVYAILLGVLFVVLGVKLHRWDRSEGLPNPA